MSFIIYHKEIFILIFLFTAQYLDFYTIYSKNVEYVNGGRGFAINLLIYMTALYVSLKEKSNENNLLSKILMVSILIIPLSLINPLITRLNYYLLPIMMVIYPRVFNIIKNKLLRLSFLWLVVLFTLYSFRAYFVSPIHSPYYKEYNTFFSSPYF